MRLLYPAVEEPAELDDDELARVYAYPDPAAPGRGWVRANFVSTLDGSATGPDRLTGSINTTPDRVVFALLRSLADVILVGAGTARAEGYRPPEADPRWAGIRVGRPSAPAMAVVTRSGLLPPLLRGVPDADLYLVTCANAPAPQLQRSRESLGSARVIVSGSDDVDLPAAVSALSERGLGKILCEGGPHLVHDVAAAGVLDELCLTTSPMVVGGHHSRILAGGAVNLGFELWSLVAAGSTVLGRWVRTAHRPPDP